MKTSAGGRVNRQTSKMAGKLNKLSMFTTTKGKVAPEMVLPTVENEKEETNFLQLPRPRRNSGDDIIINNNNESSDTSSDSESSYVESQSNSDLSD